MFKDEYKKGLFALHQLFILDLEQREGEESLMNKKVEKILSKAYFIGGSPCSGKSLIAESLAIKHDLMYYKVDDYEQKHIRMSTQDRHPIMFKWSQMCWDEIWMRPVMDQVEEEFLFYQERFSMILDELNDFPLGSRVILESAALLPQLLHVLPISKERILYMIPSKEFQIKNYSKRPFIKPILDQCANPEQAFTNWMERDHVFGEKVRAQAQELGFRTIYVDGTRSIESTIEIVRSYFRLSSDE